MAFKKEGLTPIQESKVISQGHSKIMQKRAVFEGLFSLNLQKLAVFEFRSRKRLKNFRPDEF